MFCQYWDMQLVWFSNCSCFLNHVHLVFSFVSLISFCTDSDAKEKWWFFSIHSLLTVCITNSHELLMWKNLFLCCFDCNLQICSTVQFLPWRPWEGIYMLLWLGAHSRCDRVFQSTAMCFMKSVVLEYASGTRMWWVFCGHLLQS